MSASEKIVDAVMTKILSDLQSLMYYRAGIKWGKRSNLFWDEAFTDIDFGVFSIRVFEFKEDGFADYRRLEFSAFGSIIRTDLDKRPFCRAELPHGWGDAEFIDWAKRVFAAL